MKIFHTPQSSSNKPCKCLSISFRSRCVVVVAFVKVKVKAFGWRFSISAGNIKLTQPHSLHHPRAVFPLCLQLGTVRAPGWGQPEKRRRRRERGRTSRRSTSRRNRGNGKIAARFRVPKPGPTRGAVKWNWLFANNQRKVATNEAAATLVSFVCFWLRCDLFKVWWRILWLHALVRERPVGDNGANWQ